MTFTSETRVRKSPQGRVKKQFIVLAVLCLPSMSISCVRRIGHGSQGNSDVLITGGKETTSFPAVVRLDIQGGSTCTGSFISDQILLTAAHCFKDEKDKVTVGSVSALKISIHPSFTSTKSSTLPIAESAFDIALVQFPPKTSSSTLPLSKTSAKSGDKVVLVGYGSTKSDTLEASSTKRTGTSAIKDIVRGVFIVSGTSGSIPAPDKNPPSPLSEKSKEKPAADIANSSVGPGDSGGPLLSANGKEILGVTSSVAASEGPVSYAMFADVNSSSSIEFFKKAAHEGMFPREQLPAAKDQPLLTPKNAPPRIETQATPPSPNINSPQSLLPAPPEEVVRSLVALGVSRVYTMTQTCRDLKDKSWFIGPSVIYADRKGQFLWTCNLESPAQFIIRGDCDKGLDNTSEIVRCK